jgi:hypothetical protein
MLDPLYNVLRFRRILSTNPRSHLVYHPRFSSSTKSYTNTRSNNGSVSSYILSIFSAFNPEQTSLAAQRTFNLSCPGSPSNSFLAASLYQKISTHLPYSPRPPSHTKEDTHTLNFTINPISHSFSRWTFVKFSGVFSGFPPLGISRIKSLCCA